MQSKSISLIRQFARFFSAATFSFALNAMASSEVVVYSSVDQEFAEPVLKRFEKDTGIKVKAIFDAEASKTVGLERRLLAEKAQPKADVFWNSEYLRTIRLASEGVLANYKPAAAAAIPAQFRVDSGLWSGFGVRARVLLINTNLISAESAPKKLSDLTDPKFKGKIAIAKPYFGTTSTHFAALYSDWGMTRFVDFLKALKGNEVALLPGNADVRDAVVDGRYAIGLTDTDDAATPVKNGKAVRIVFPDQDGKGAFGVFHTVSLVRGGPNADSAKRLVDFLTGEDVERMLIEAEAVQLPVRSGIPASAAISGTPRVWHAASAELLKVLPETNKLIRAHLE